MKQRIEEGGCYVGMSQNVRRVILAIIVVAATVSIATAASEGDEKVWRDGDVIFGDHGSGPVLSPTSAIQYGYLSSIPELDGIFSTDVANAQNEATAFFTFFNTATTLRATVQGGLTVVTREGTMTIYLNSAPNGTFDVPESFADGTPVQVSNWQHQVILDSATGRFTVQFMNEITSVKRFQWKGESIQLGKVGKHFSINGSGLLRGPGLFDLAAYAVLGGHEKLRIAGRWHDED